MLTFQSNPIFRWFGGMRKSVKKFQKKRKGW